MGAFIIGKVLSRALMTGKAGLFYIISKMKGKRFMRIGVAGKAVFQFKMGPPFVAHGAFRNDIFSPGRMLFMAIKTGNLCLMLSSVAGDRSRLILVAFYTVGHLQGNQFRSRNLLSKNKQYCCRKNYSTQFS
jgi:hypothetical protein